MPLRIRPYVTMPDLGAPDAPASPPPVPPIPRVAAPPSAPPVPGVASPSPSRSPSPKPSAPVQGPTLRFGDSGADVEKLQRLLADQGLYRGRINGQFDSRVERAVSTFQFENGIDDEEWGVYGPVTRRALEG
ncbi:peptidoglycan-binding domain-containing protein [Streptomyces sp. H27-S2]|uniref:peptidoglycan-binding domain-containing protein n=1 Tax=Streptomyces antarcticus TaxID=2996458 RepID=UPI002271991B|nr:peptidoglycan-binding domain-containing protein [Streptomyces sp. H27-S2]MCY0948666.1 peptidoglycan-binding domain-containing protein [Streptomyces sp. H27-S2]